MLTNCKDRRLPRKLGSNYDQERKGRKCQPQFGDNAQHSDRSVMESDTESPWETNGHSASHFTDGGTSTQRELLTF